MAGPTTSIDDLIKDRVVLINFFFTSCGETCPLVTAEPARGPGPAGRADGPGHLHVLGLAPARARDAGDPQGLCRAVGCPARAGTSSPAGPTTSSCCAGPLGFASVDPDFDLILDNHTGLLRYGNERLDRWAGTPALGAAGLDRQGGDLDRRHGPDPTAAATPCSSRHIFGRITTMLDLDREIEARARAARPAPRRQASAAASSPSWG